MAWTLREQNTVQAAGAGLAAPPVSLLAGVLIKAEGLEVEMTLLTSSCDL